MTKDDEIIIYKTLIDFAKAIGKHRTTAKKIIESGEWQGWKITSERKEPMIIFEEVLEFFNENRCSHTDKELTKAIAKEFKTSWEYAYELCRRAKSTNKAESTERVRMPQRIHRGAENIEPYKELLSVATEYAVKDYRQALKTLQRNPGSIKAQYDKSQIERFFNSNLYDWIAPIPGPELIEVLRGQVYEQ